jgi:hypothetical protein
MKNFVCQIDVTIIELISQKSQFDILKHYIGSENKIIFHSIENLETRSFFMSLKDILKNSSKIDGIVFFSLMQFCYNKNDIIDIKFLELLAKKYELIFFRESLLFKNYKGFLKDKKSILLFKQNNLRLVNKFI